jgi:FixJ family two-component response regulator
MASFNSGTESDLSRRLSVVALIGGVVSFIGKPFTHSELSEKVARILDSGADDAGDHVRHSDS